MPLSVAVVTLGSWSEVPGSSPTGTWTSGGLSGRGVAILGRNSPVFRIVWHYWEGLLQALSLHLLRGHLVIELVHLLRPAIKFHRRRSSWRRFRCFFGLFHHPKEDRPRVIDIFIWQILRAPDHVKAKTRTGLFILPFAAAAQTRYRHWHTI